MRRPIFVPMLIALLTFSGAGAIASGGQATEQTSVTPPGYFGKYDPMIDIEWVKFAGQANLESINTKLKPVTGETVEDTRWHRLFRLLGHIRRVNRQMPDVIDMLVPAGDITLYITADLRNLGIALDVVNLEAIVFHLWQSEQVPDFCE